MFRIRYRKSYEVWKGADGAGFDQGQIHTHKQRTHKKYIGNVCTDTTNTRKHKWFLWRHSTNLITALYRVLLWQITALVNNRNFLKHVLSDISIICEQLDYHKFFCITYVHGEYDYVYWYQHDWCSWLLLNQFICEVFKNIVVVAISSLLG